MPKMLETILGVLRGEIAPPPIFTLLGFSLISADRGAGAVAFTADGRYANAMGTLHGGILCDLADAAMGVAFGTTLEEGESFTTLELKINYLRPVRSGMLTASARVIQSGRTVGFVECDVTDEDKSLVARATSTCLIRKT